MEKTIKGMIDRDKLPPPGFTDYFIIVDEFKDDNRKNEDRLADKKERIFNVRAVLTKEYKFSKDIDLNIENGGSFLLETTGAVKIQLQNQYGIIFGLKNDLNEIYAFEGEIKATAYFEAFKIFNKSLLPFIDYLSYFSNTPIVISRISCLDIINQIRTISYLVPYNNVIVNQHYGKVYEDLIPIFVLYREAKNNQSPFYKFLCYYKILEGIFKSIRPALMFKKKSERKTIVRLEENVPYHPEISYKHKEQIGKKIQSAFNDFFADEFRNVVAHFILKDGRFLNVSEYQTNEDFDKAVLLLELCVRKVLDNEIKYHEM